MHCGLIIHGNAIYADPLSDLQAHIGLDHHLNDNHQPQIALLASSASIELVSLSARVTSVKFQKGVVVTDTETPGSGNKNTNQNQIQGDLPAVENLQAGQSPLTTAGQHIFHVTMSQCYHIIMFPNPNVSTSQYSSIKNSSAPPSIDHASHNVSREQQFFDMDTAVSYRLVLSLFNHYFY